MGRPPEFPFKKLVGFDQEMLDALDAYRASVKPIPNQSEAIRSILREWLASNGFLKTS
jgi:Arc/MetJ-type ribon-helix-helix transcriptional regulator